MFEEHKLSIVPNYEILLTDEQFEWSHMYFKKLDDALFNLNRLGLKKQIKKIHDFIQQKIVKCFIVEFNKIFKTEIWNHFDLLLKNPDKINWKLLSMNNAAVELLKANQDKINWDYLSQNSSTAAVELLKANQEKINWYYLSRNSSAAAIELLEANQEKINWSQLTLNLAAKKLLKKNMSKISWFHFDYFMFGGAIKYSYGYARELKKIKANQEEINWDYLSANPHNYQKEKIKAFNKLNLFPNSHMKIKRK